MELLGKLKERGLVYQMTSEEMLGEMLDGPPQSFYIGFDSTARSLHLGNLVPMVLARHLQAAGHRPLMVVGGGTALVGDPSGRSTERPLVEPDEVAEWSAAIGRQLEGFMDGGGADAEVLDNSDWLLDLSLVDFLREVGKRFSVNRMLTAESVRLRLETGISYLEFSYSLLQAYDFLHLYRERGCRLQAGGSDQWGNIVAGIDLVRRVCGGEACGFTCPLVTTSTGGKMSKTQPGGAIWLDPEMTSPYDFHQFWMNVDDADVGRFLGLYTFLPMDEVRELASLEGSDIRRAKGRLAREVTTLVHGAEEAEAAERAARSLFGGGRDLSEVPTLELPASRLPEVTWLDLFTETGLCGSRGEVRRLGSQGGLYADDVRIEDPTSRIDVDEDGKAVLIRAGKKRYYRVVFVR